MMKAPTYTFINNINIPTPTSYPSSHDKTENAVFDDDDPTHSVDTPSTTDERSFSNNSYHQYASDDNDDNYTFDDDDPSTSSPRSSSSADAYDDNRSYGSTKFQ